MSKDSAKTDLRGLMRRVERLESEPGEISARCRRPILNVAHGAVNDVETEAAAAAPRSGITEIRSAPQLGVERTAMIPDQEESVRWTWPLAGREGIGRHPPQFESRLRVGIEAVLRHIGACLVQRGGQELGIGARE